MPPGPDAASPSGGEWPAADLARLSACPLCRDAGRVLVHDNLEDKIFGGAPGRWRLYQCTGCHCAYLDPRPTRQTIGRAYGRYFARGEDSGPDNMADGGSVREALVNGYLNRRYGYRFRPDAQLGRFVLPLFPRRRFREDNRVRHLARPQEPQRLLDVGFGGGEFLRLMRSGGWAVSGIETDDTAIGAGQAAGLDVRPGTIEQAPYADDSFDVVTLSHVIEHLHDPVQGLRECARVLRPGGRLWVATPNIASPGHSLFGQSWFGLDPPRHLVLFERDSLDNALEQARFRSVRHLRSYQAGLVVAGSEALRDGRDASKALTPKAWWYRSLALMFDFAAATRREWGEELLAVARAPD